MITSYKDFNLGSNLYRNGVQGIIYTRFKLKNKDIRRSTGEVDEKKAQQVAWAIYCAEAGIYNDQATSLRRSTYMTIDELGGIYVNKIAADSKCSHKTAIYNRNNLLNMAELVGYPKIRLDKLNRDFVEDWRKARYAQKGLVYGQDVDLSLNYSLNSTFRQAKCVFSRDSLALYKRMQIKIPDNIEDSFKAVPFLKAKSTCYVPISEDIDEAIKLLTDVALGIKSSEDLNAWIAIDPIFRGKYADIKYMPSISTAVAVQLARYCGLTVKEMLGLRWDWFERRNGNCFISIRYRPASATVPAWESKGNAKNGNVPISAERLGVWKTQLGESKSGYVFDAKEHNQRYITVERLASSWLRLFLADRTKSLHELRKQAGSDVATKHGIYVAAKFLRDSIAVVEKHYAAILTPMPPLG